VITYHGLAQLFRHVGLNVGRGLCGTKPDFLPNRSHADVNQHLKRENVKLIFSLVEPYFDLRTPNSIGQPTRRRVVLIPRWAENEITSYFQCSTTT